MAMGISVYTAQGQFTYNPAYQGLPIGLCSLALNADLFQVSQLTHTSFKHWETRLY